MARLVGKMAIVAGGALAMTGAAIVADGGLTAGTRLSGFPAFGGGSYG